MPIEKYYGSAPTGCHPDDFEPDMEVCRPEEIAAWQEAKRTGAPLELGHGFEMVERKGRMCPAFVARNPWGLGTVSMEITQEEWDFIYGS